MNALLTELQCICSYKWILYSLNYVFQHLSCYWMPIPTATYWTCHLSSWVLYSVRSTCNLWLYVVNCVRDVPSMTLPISSCYPSSMHALFTKPIYSFPYMGVRCSSMVRVFAHGAMGCRIDPSWWTYWAISHSSQCSTTGITKAVVCVILAVG